MPNYYTSSFTTSDGIEDSFAASLGFTQSTEATQLSDYGNTVAGARQVCANQLPRRKHLNSIRPRSIRSRTAFTLVFDGVHIDNC